MKKQILVTGGTGYIGSHTCVELINEGYEVVIIDNLSNSSIEVLDGIQAITGIRPAFEQFDICDKAKVDAFFVKYPNLDAVIHFAASKAVGESVSEPLMYYRNNLMTLINLLGVMRQNKVSNLIFSSSCTVYGQPKQLPVNEQAPIQKAMSPYGNTKQIAEEIIQDSISAYKDLRSIALRYFNPVGAHPSGTIGELPIGVPQNLVPFVTQTAIGIRDQLKVYGNDYNTPDGSCIRDYIHVVDLAKAHVVAVRRLLENKNKNRFEVFNLGTGRGVSVLEIIKTFEKISGVKLNFVITARREGDIEQIWAEPEYANKELGWTAKSTLDETLLSAWKWEQNIRAKQNK